MRNPLPLSAIWVLGGLIALSAIAVDITLVALPATAMAVEGDPARSGLIITAYLAGFAPGQLLWGMAGDRYGRRRTVLAGLLCFILATAACALATTFPALLAARVAQGFAGGSGPVLSRAIVRDVADDAGAARLLALLTAILGTAPLLAPVIGAALLAAIDWRSIFWFTAIYGVLLTAVAVRYLPESRPAAQSMATGGVVTRTTMLLRDRDFRTGLALVALPFGGYHTLLALYPTVVIVEFGLAESIFTWLMAAAAACFVVGSTISRTLVARVGMPSLVRIAIVLCCLGACTAGVGTLAEGIVMLVAGAGLYMLGVGQALPLATAIALRRARDAAGWAAAILGLVQVGGGALLSLVATVTGEPLVSLPATLLVCALAALAVVAHGLR